MKAITALLVPIWVLTLQCPAADPASGRILQVGPNRPCKNPSAAAAAAHDGDTVEIDAGDDEGDVAVWRADRLTIRGVNGLAHLKAGGRSAEQKAIWVIKGRDTVVEHVGFSGCRVPDRNGAGIRQEGDNLTVRHCRFHDNEDGILTGASPQSEILVEHTEFARNGAGDGYSHNIYVGNVLQHGPAAENGVAVSYAAEGARNPVQELYVVNNTFVNERRASGCFLRVAGKEPRVLVVNNLVVGTKAVLQGPGEVRGNVVTETPGFVDAAGYDYRLKAGSPAIGAGTDPGRAGEVSLMPEFLYRHPLGKEARAWSGRPNAGAY